MKYWKVVFGPPHLEAIWDFMKQQRAKVHAKTDLFRTVLSESLCPLAKAANERQQTDGC